MKVLQNVVTPLLQSLDQAQNDIAVYEPNPLYHYNDETNRNAQSQTLILVDGGKGRSAKHPVLSSSICQKLRCNIRY
jgi:hypothetical protein